MEPCGNNSRLAFGQRGEKLRISYSSFLQGAEASSTSAPILYFMNKKKYNFTTEDMNARVRVCPECNKAFLDSSSIWQSVRCPHCGLWPPVVKNKEIDLIANMAIDTYDPDIQAYRESFLSSLRKNIHTIKFARWFESNQMSFDLFMRLASRTIKSSPEGREQLIAKIARLINRLTI